MWNNQSNINRVNYIIDVYELSRDETTYIPDLEFDTYDPLRSVLYYIPEQKLDETNEEYSDRWYNEIIRFNTRNILNFNIKDIRGTLTNRHYNNICNYDTITSDYNSLNNFNDIIASIYLTINNIYDTTINAEVITQIVNMFEYIFNSNRFHFKYNRDMNGDIIIGNKVLDDDNVVYTIQSIDYVSNTVYLEYFINGTRNRKFESITNFNNKNYSTIDSDDNITVPSKTIFKHRKYYFYGDNNHILYLDNIVNYPINHEYYSIIVDVNDLYSDDLSTSLNFAKKLIYNFDIIILEYDDDENIIGHNTIYDLYQCCERSDCNNKGDPIGRDGNNNCVCECDEQRFTGNNCQYTFQTCGDTDHNNPDNIRPFNCGNKGTLKQYPLDILCDTGGDCTYDMCCDPSPSPPPSPISSQPTVTRPFGMSDGHIADIYKITCSSLRGFDTPCTNYYTGNILDSGYHICKPESGNAKNIFGKYFCDHPGEKDYLDCELVDSNNKNSGCRLKN